MGVNLNTNNNINQFSMCIGGIYFSLKFDNKDFFQESKDQFQNFIIDDPVNAIEVDVKFSSGDINNYDNKLAYPRIEQLHDKSYNIIWSGLEATFNSETKQGKLVCVHLARLNSFLRITVSIVLLEQQQGFIVHASSLIRNSKGYVFPGKSGAGKTTITQLSSDSKLLTDEVSLVKKVNGEFKAYGTPFYGEFVKSGENISSSLNKIIFPIKDKENILNKIGPFQALELLLPNVICYYDNPELKKKLFELCFEFVNTVPTFELHFLPEPTFWRSIDVE
jgi:hypothetical protein